MEIYNENDHFKDALNYKIKPEIVMDQQGFKAYKRLWQEKEKIAKELDGSEWKSNNEYDWEYSWSITEALKGDE